MTQRQSQCQHDLTSCCSWSPDVTIQGVHLIWDFEKCIQCILNCILQNVKMTLCSTLLGHQMPLPGGYISSEISNYLCIQSILNCILKNVKMTLYSTLLGHQILLAGGQLVWGYTLSENMTMSTWPYVVLLLAMRCLNGGTAHLRVHLIQKYELTSEFTLVSQRSFLQKTNKQVLRADLNCSWELFFLMFNGNEF